MRTLAIDHGLSRCGVAVCDPSGTIVTPLEPVEPPDPDAVARLVAEREIERVVVGLPVTLGGSEGEQAALAREFAEALAERLTVPVETYDERLTTALAGASRRAGARAAEDSLAAAHLLESFLAARSSR